MWRAVHSRRAVQSMIRAYSSLGRASPLVQRRLVGYLDRQLCATTTPTPSKPAFVMAATPDGISSTDGQATANYRPHLLPPESTASDWVKELELHAARAFSPPDFRIQNGSSSAGTGSNRGADFRSGVSADADATCATGPGGPSSGSSVTAPHVSGSTSSHPPRILVLYGSLRARSYSRLLAYEFARVLEHLGAEVRVYDPQGLPMKDEVSMAHAKVAELRELSLWSEGQVWVSPEQHGAITGVFKNQLDWIPLDLGSVRPTQGRTLAVAQVNGGSQSFNAVNTMRLLGRWMRMITIPNQSSVPKAWTEFDDAGRMKASSLRDRVVDVAEELYKFTLLTRGHANFLVDRYSERQEKRAKGRLLSQAEKEAAKAAEEVVAAARVAAAAADVAVGSAPAAAT